MDGINWADQASVKEWVESPEGLVMSEAARGLAMKGDILESYLKEYKLKTLLKHEVFVITMRA